MKKVLSLIGLVAVVSFAFYSARPSLKSAESLESKLAPISIYSSEGELLKISIEDVGEEHGDICPCVAVTFRAIQSAVLRLWKGEVPQRSDFRIISKCPSHGSQDVFEFIVRAKTDLVGKGDFKIELPEGTSIKNVRACNFAFIFIRKSSGDTLEVYAKESVFPQGFFQIRTKVSYGQPTLQEKEAFEGLKEEVKQTILSLAPDELFIFKEASAL